MTPVSRQPSLPATLLQYLNTACKHRAMYPSQHPIVVRAMSDLVQVVDLLLRDRETIAVTIYQDTFFLDNQMLPEESLRNANLIRICLERNIGVFTFHRGVTTAEISAFVSLLLAPVDAVRAVGGAEQYLIKHLVGRITVDVPRTEPPSADLQVQVDPANTYEAGQNVAQELRTQAVRRQPLDMNKARVFLSAAVEVMRENRASLLGLMVHRDYDEGSSYHAVNVSLLSMLIGVRLGFSHEQLVALGMSGLLHDIGKVRVPPDLLNRATEFTPEEQELLKRHTVHGGNILRDASGPGGLAATVALEHHAHFDGSGYPSLRVRARPHIFSRIVAVVDSFDTLTAVRRGVHLPLRPELGMKWIAAGLGTIFDPTVGKLFVQMMGLYPVGSLVELGSGDFAIVLRPSEWQVDRPLLQVVRDGHLAEVIDLENDMSQWIARGVDPSEANIDVEELLHRPTAAA